MATDNRTEINDCSATTGWAGDDAVTVVTDTGLYYEGTSSLSAQFSNADEHMYTTEDSLNTGTFSIDFSTSTLYMIIKDNLIDTKTNGGIKFVVGDGTNRIGYEVGGYDNTGVSLPQGFNAYRLDVSNRSAFTGHAFAGTEANYAPSTTTQIGYGSLHLSKAVGAVDNLWMDGFRYISNTSYALTVNGGTSGTPIDFATLASDDQTNGWGLISNPIGSQYVVGGTVEFGSSTADAYFEEIGSQIYLNGDGIGSGNFIFRILGSAGNTQSFVLDNCAIVSTGEPAKWDLSDTNHNTMSITNCLFVGCGTFNLPAQSVNRTLENTSFTDCGTITQNNMTITSCTISNGTTSPFVTSSGNDCDDITDCTFVGDGTTTPGHAVDLGTVSTGTAVSPYTISWGNILDNGANQSTWEGSTQASTAGTQGTANDALTVNVTSGNYCKIAVANGGTIPTVRNTGTGNLEITANEVTLTVKVVDIDTGSPIEGAMVYITTDAGVTAIIDKVETDSNGEVSDTRSLGSDKTLDGRVRAASPGTHAYTKYYKTAGVAGTYSQTANTNITIQMIPDQ